jgi:hypothetical protein
MQNVYGGDNGVSVTDGFIMFRLAYFGVRGDEGFMEPIKASKLVDVVAGDCKRSVCYFDIEAMKTLGIQA